MTAAGHRRPRTRLRRRGSLLGALFAVALLCGLGAEVAWAYWTAEAAPGGNGAAAAATVDQGATPLATGQGNSVTVSWAARSLSDGTPVDGYVVTRYDIGTFTSQPLLSACAGTLTALTCTEANVPEGRWVYSVTPAFATSWRGLESLKSSPVWVDSTPPVNAVTVSGVTGNAAKSGDTVYYRGAAAGSFTLTNAVSDSGSGPASSTTADLAGSSSGWSHTPSTVSTPTGGPFVSAPFSWNPGTSSAPDEVITGRDALDNAAATTISFVDDSTGPTGGSVGATNVVGTGAAYAASTSVSLTFAKGSDPRGVTTGALLQRATATLTSDGTSDGDCGAFGAYATVPGGTDPASPKSDIVTDQACYSYQYVVLDNLGNTATYTSDDVKVDLTAPSAPTRTFGSFANTYWNGVSNSVFYRSTATTGSFTVTASADDAESGVASYTFPAAAQIGTNWIATAGPLGETTYSWTSTPAGSTARSITATNHATKVSTASATFTPTVDNTAPTAGSVSYLNGATTGATVNVSFTSGTDTGSGMATKVLERASAPMTGGLCGTFTAFSAITSNPTSPYVDPVATDTCYMYDYETPDNVGNQRTNTSASVVKVSEDVTGPTGGSVTATGLVGTDAQYTAGTIATLILDKGTDPNGPAATGNLVRRATATLISGGAADGTCGTYGAFATVATDPASPYSNTALTTGCYLYQYVVPDNLGNPTTYTSDDVKVDTTAPSAPTRTFGSFTNTYWNGVSALVYYRPAATTGSFTVTASATDTQSGIASYTFPTAAQIGTNWIATAGPLGEATYSWTSTPAGSTARSLTATNHATKVSAVSTTFTPTVDSTSPTAGSVSYLNGATAGSTVSVSFTSGTDTGSGLATKVLERASAPMTGGLCGTFTAFSAITNNPTSPYVDTVATDTCYMYDYETPDNVGNQRTNTSASIVKVSEDVTGPTGGSVTATGLVGTNAQYTPSTIATLILNKGTDPNGPAATGNLVRRATATLLSGGAADGTCGTYGAFATVATDPASPYSNTALTTGCYLYQYVVPDNLGNTTTYTSGEVRVDTTAPSAPTRTFGSFTNTYWDGVSALLYYRPSATTGSFTVTASATDTQSGVASYTFPTGAAFGTNWTSTPGALGVNTYSWSGTPAAVTAKSITATNHATKISAVSTTFTPTADSAAPTGGTVAYPNGGTPNTTVSVTLGTVSDAGSGVASRVLQRASAPLSGGLCGTFTAFSTLTSNPTSPYNDSLVMDTCYQYQYVVTDNLGNQATGTSTNVVKVSTDVTGPTGGSVTATGLVGTGSQYTASTIATLTLNKGTDPNGPASTGNLVRRATATLLSGGTADGTCGTYGAFATVATDPASPYSNTALTTGCYLYQYVVADNLGNTTTYTSGEVRVDTTAPSAPTRTFGSFTNTYWDGVSSLVYYQSTAATGSFTVTASATDTQSGVASYTFPTGAAFGTNWTSTPGALGVNTYSWSGTPAAVTAKSITATNHATKISAVSTTFTPTVDNTAPTAGSISYTDITTTSTSVSVGFTTGTDSGSGLGARLLQRSSAPLTGSTCGTYGTFTTIASPPASSPYNDTVPSSGFCYKYQYVVSDNVGNQTTATSPNVVKVSP